MINGDERVAKTVRSRYRVLAVDDHRDTDPAEQRLLDAWLGDGRDLTAARVRATGPANRPSRFLLTAGSTLGDGAVTAAAWPVLPRARRAPGPSAMRCRM